MKTMFIQTFMVLFLYFGCHRDMTPTNDIVSIQLNNNHYAEVGLYDSTLPVSKRSEIQVVSFMSDNNIVKDLHVTGLDTVTKINYDSYYLSRIGVDSFESLIFYILYFYSSNGKPEFYCYHDYKGNLLALQECTRSGCKTHTFTIEGNALTKYLELDQPVMMKEIDIIPSHYSN